MFADSLMKMVSTLTGDSTGIAGNSSSYPPAHAWLPIAINGYI